MTLNEAGKLYGIQTKKLEETTDLLDILYRVIKSSEDPGPAIGSFTTCIVRTDILKRIVVVLEEHSKHLKNVLDKEIGG